MTTLKVLAKLLFTFALILGTACEIEPKNPIEVLPAQSKKKTEESKAQNGAQAKMAKYQNVELVYEASTYEDMIQLQKEYKVILYDSFSKFQVHPEVQKKSNFLKENSFFSLPRGPVATQAMILPGEKNQYENPLGFEIVVMPVEYKSYYPVYVVVQNRTMRIIADFKVKEWLGIIVMHEMVHIVDRVVHKVEKFGPTHELKAYSFEKDLLKIWNPDGYNSMIEESNYYVSKIGGFNKVQQKDLRNLGKIAAKYYPLSPDIVTEAELSLGAAACVMAMMLEYDSNQTEADKVKTFEHVANVMMGR